MKNFALVVLVLLSACAKVGPPLPPIVKIPQKVDRLSATQSGYSVVLSWTNPEKYIDDNAATDLGVVHVFRNGVEIQTMDAGKAGQPQSVVIDAKKSIDTPLTFTIQMVLPRGGKSSAVSNSASIKPVDVPGAPLNLRAVVDLGKIALAWDPPVSKPQLVEGYLVQRADAPAVFFARETHYDDEEFEPGKTYVYTVTAVRGTSPQIAGDGAATKPVDAVDGIPPHIPTGLKVDDVGGIALIRWDDNLEPDLKGYQLLRSDWAEPMVRGKENGFSDPTYMPGMGLSYRLLAEDKSGNKSALSPPAIPGP